MIEIKKPIWNGNKQRCVGLAEYRVVLEGNIIQVNITYRNEEGLLLYPEPLFVRKTNIVKYPTQNAGGTKVFVIPICDMATTPEMNRKYVPYDIPCPKCHTEMRQNMKNLIVTYHCDKCGKDSCIHWEIDPIIEEQKDNILNDTKVPEPKLVEIPIEQETILKPKEKLKNKDPKHIDKQTGFL